MTICDSLAALLALVSMLRNEILAYLAFRAGFSIWPYLRPRSALAPPAWRKLLIFERTLTMKYSTLHRYQQADAESWALVTGASHGIGLAFAQELLNRGFNVLIHGRNKEKLDAIRGRLSKQHPPRSIQILVADAAEANIDYDAIIQTVQSLPGKLTILINNVGGSPVVPSFVPLEELPESNIDTIINVNARFQTHLTSRLLPILKANGPSVIVCCSSTAGLVGMPYIVAYSSTKGYVNGLCNSLRAELSTAAEGRDGAKVDVHGLLIGEVDTSNTGARPKSSFLVVSPQELVTAALNKFGCSRTLVWAHWIHALQYQVMRILPERVQWSILARVMGTKREAERRSLKTE